MEDILNNIYAFKALQSIALAIIVTILAKIAILVSAKGRKRTSEAPHAIKYTAIFFFGFAFIFIWLEGVGPILTALTIVAAALTIVAKELILNFFGSVVIFWRELFAIGDRVQIGEYSGDVIDKGLLYFTLLEVGRTPFTGHSTGRLIKVPNALTLTTPVVNATRGAGYLWHEIHFSLTGKSDWEKARGHLIEITHDFQKSSSINLEKVKRVFESRKIYFNKLTPKVYVSTDTNGITLTLRYICGSREVSGSEDFITTRFLQELESGGIELSVRR